MANPAQSFKCAPAFKGAPAPALRPGDAERDTAGPWRRRNLLLAFAAGAAGGAAPQQDAPPGAAIFPFILDDTSLEGEMDGARADQAARLGRLDEQLRDLLVTSGRCVPVDVAPVAVEARASDLRTCGACAVDLAKRLGARLVVVGWVQKVSNLIININVMVRDVGSGRLVAGGSVDIRGNTDLSWSRGLRFLARERLLASPWAVSPRKVSSPDVSP